MFPDEPRNFFMESGAGDRIRTGDIDLGKVALYQLSYSREGNCTYGIIVARGPQDCQIRRR
jgi:hypothetical protein